MGSRISFNKIIDDTITEFIIDYSVTLLTRFGGVLGLTKNLFWSVLMYITLASYFVSSLSGTKKRNSRK